MSKSYTDVDICNMALGYLTSSNSARITSLDGTSTEAQGCNLYYENCVGQALQMGMWGFATDEVVLGALEETPLFKYAHFIQLPTDWKRTVEIMGHTGSIYTEDDYALRRGGRLAINAEKIHLLYIARVDEGDFTPLFIEVVSRLLASSIATNLYKDDNASQTNYRLALTALRSAKFSDATNDHEQLKKKSRWLAGGGHEYRFDESIEIDG